MTNNHDKTASELAENCRGRRDEEGGGGWRVTELQFADYIHHLEFELEEARKERDRLRKVPADIAQSILNDTHKAYRDDATWSVNEIIDMIEGFALSPPTDQATTEEP